MRLLVGNHFIFKWNFGGSISYSEILGARRDVCLTPGRKSKRKLQVFSFQITISIRFDDSERAWVQCGCETGEKRECLRIIRLLSIGDQLECLEVFDSFFAVPFDFDFSKHLSVIARTVVKPSSRAESPHPKCRTEWFGWLIAKVKEIFRFLEAKTKKSLSGKKFVFYSLIFCRCWSSARFEPTDHSNTFPVLSFPIYPS